MNNEIWSVGSHRTVNRRMDNGLIAPICEIYSGAADSLAQADQFQCLIAAAPELLHELQQLVAGLNYLFGPEKAEGITEDARAAIAKATADIREAGTK